MQQLATLAATLALVAFLVMEVFNEAGWNWKDLEGKVDSTLDDKSMRYGAFGFCCNYLVEAVS